MLQGGGCRPTHHRFPGLGPLPGMARPPQHPGSRHHDEVVSPIPLEVGTDGRDDPFHGKTQPGLRPPGRRRGTAGRLPPDAIRSDENQLLGPISVDIPGEERICEGGAVGWNHRLELKLKGCRPTSTETSAGEDGQLRHHRHPALAWLPSDADPHPQIQPFPGGRVVGKHHEVHHRFVFSVCWTRTMTDQRGGDMGDPPSRGRPGRTLIWPREGGRNRRRRHRQRDCGPVR